jgi:uncharacterized repeat protein (TIGR01451 family)
MNTHIHEVAVRKGWRLAAAAAVAILLALLVGVQASYAQSGGGMCVRDAADFDQKNICTSDDVKITQMRVITGPTSCVAGETISVTFQAAVESGSKKRYDIGFYIAEDGGNAMDRGSTCFRDYLHPVSADNTDLNLTGGAGPFWNGEISQDPADTCGDVEKNGASIYNLGPISITCMDTDGDNILDVGTVVSWDSGRKNTCLSEADAVPSGKSKCWDGIVAIGDVVVPATATLEVRNVLAPSTDAGRFNLQIDGQTKAAAVGNGGTTGPVTVSAGTSVEPGETHTVGETAVPPTDLANYDTTIYCVDGEQDEFTRNDAGPLEVVVEPGDAMVCTITNTRNKGSIGIVKATDPPGLPGSFSFSSNTDPISFTLTHGQDQQFSGLALRQSYSFTETVPSGWMLTNINCVGATESTVVISDATVTIGILVGEHITCTFTDDPLPDIYVTKTADPASVYVPGGTVTYTVRVDNSGSEAVTLTSLIDKPYGDITAASNTAISTTTCAVTQVISGGNYYACSFKAMVIGNVGDSTTDVVTATVQDAEQNVMQAKDDAKVVVVAKPPPTGVDLPGSYVAVGLAVVGVALLAVGVFAYRRMLRVT